MNGGPREKMMWMIHLTKIALPLLTLAAVSPAAAAEVYKCLQGGRILYQAEPCPPGSQAQARLPPAPEPDPASIAQARAEAKADLAAAAALRRREAQEEAQRRAHAAAAERQALACARRLEVIRMLEAPTTGETQTAKKQGHRLALQERKAYIRECGPLPR